MVNRMIFSLDIGSSKIVSMVGSIGEKVEIHGISNYYFVNNNRVNDFLSVANGVICNLESIEQKVLQILKEAQINADCSLGSVIVNIAGSNVCNYHSSSKLELRNQGITSDIIHKLIENARQVEIPSQYEVLDFEVQEYLIDNENYAVNPIHLNANIVESNINLFLGNTSQISNLRKILRYSSYDLAKLVPSGILSGMAVLNYEEKELGCCLIDIGAGTTDIVVYENGFIRYLCSIPVGGENITRDIASVLKISRNLAEDIKLNYGGTSYASTTAIGQKFAEGIVLTDHRGINTTISRKLLIDVICERLKDIFDVVKSALTKQKIYDIISSGIVITGGSSLLPNLEDFAKQYFDMPVRIGLPEYEGDFADLIVSPKYASSIGGLYFAQEYMLHEISGSVNRSSGSLLDKIKGMFSHRG
ncbi:MAG: cell division protein FtsA [Burkholderiales bacterium]|nr:cell division protein FtsA [Burkholderiales bacterium]